MKQGRGKIVLKDGSVHEGEFKRDRKNGAGVMTYTDGNILRAVWVEDNL